MIPIFTTFRLRLIPSNVSLDESSHNIHEKIGLKLLHWGVKFGK